VEILDEGAISASLEIPVAELLDSAEPEGDDKGVDTIVDLVGVIGSEKSDGPKLGAGLMEFGFAAEEAVVS